MYLNVTNNPILWSNNGLNFRINFYVRFITNYLILQHDLFIVGSLSNRLNKENLISVYI